MSTIKEAEATAKQTKFQEILLGSDPEASKKENAKVEKAKGRLEEALEAINDFIGKELTDIDISKVLKGGFPVLLDTVKEDFEFKNASTEFNLKALGKDSGRAKQALKVCQLKGFLVKDGRIILDRFTEQRIKNSGLSYTSNQAQNEALKDAKVLCDILNKMVDKGYIEERYISEVRRGLSLLETGYKVKSFKISPKQIMQIEEDGKIKKVRTY